MRLCAQQAYRNYRASDKEDPWAHGSLPTGPAAWGGYSAFFLRRVAPPELPTPSPVLLPWLRSRRRSCAAPSRES